MPATSDIVEAVRSKDVTRVRRLLDENPELLMAETEEGSLILTAVYHGASDVVAELVARASELSIFEAAVLGDAERVGAILESRPGLVDEPNKDGFTPLGLAAFFGHATVARVLLTKGAAVDLVMASVNQNTALDAAVAANHMKVAELLLKSGGRVNPQAVGGYTPLHKAAFAGNVDMARLLLEHGADLSAETEEGRTPLDIAVEKGHAEVAEAFRRHLSKQ